MSWSQSDGGLGDGWGDGWDDGGKSKGKDSWGTDAWGDDGNGWSDGKAAMMKGMMGALMGVMNKGCGKDSGGKDTWGKGKSGGWSNDSLGAGKDGVADSWVKGDPWGKGGGSTSSWGKGTYSERLAGKSREPKKEWQNKNGSTYSNHKCGTYQEDADGNVGIAGLADAVTRALEPFRQNEEAVGIDMDEFHNKFCANIYSTCKTWFKTDTRHKLNDGTKVKARALLEAFINKSMESLATLCQGKVWFNEIYLSEAMALSAIHCFKVGGGGRFKRNCAPMIITHVNDFIFRYREEERITNEFYNAARIIGLKLEYEKRCEKHLKVSYDSAFLGAEYGQVAAASPELGLVQDFVKAWMTEFYSRGWDVFESGLPINTISEKVIAMNCLFHFVTDPERSCIPHDLLSALDSPLTTDLRDFITHMTTQLLDGALTEP